MHGKSIARLRSAPFKAGPFFFVPTVPPIGALIRPFRPITVEFIFVRSAFAKLCANHLPSIQRPNHMEATAHGALYAALDLALEQKLDALKEMLIASVPEEVRQKAANINVDDFLASNPPPVVDEEVLESSVQVQRLVAGNSAAQPGASERL